MAITVELPNDFTPREYQARIMRYFDRGGMRAVWNVHRRGGKDLTMAHQTAKMAHRRKGAYWHVFPTFAQARKAIWEGFTSEGKRILENVFPGFSDPKRAGSIVKRKDEQQMMIELKCGSIWRLLGSDRIEVVGAGPVGVVFSEYAIANPRAWRLISPMLRESGGWAAAISTPRGANHFKELFEAAKGDPSWFAETQPITQTEAWRLWKNKNGSLYTSFDELKGEELASGMQEALFRQEYECDWTAALVGSVWGDLIEAIEKAGGLAPFDHDHGDVFTNWDIGFTDSTSIWFWQVKDGGVDIIDHYEAHGQPLSHYFDVIDSKPYRYVKHWLPHDARQTTLASGVSILNQCMKKWPGQVAVGPDLPLLDGIQAGRWLLQQKVRIHPRCGEGIEALRSYHYEFDEEKKTFAARPAHDWSSHTADALRYVAAVVKVSNLLTHKPAPKIVEPVARPLHHSFNLEDLFAAHSARVAQRRRI